ncbi:hypothetical protein RB594_003662 [Gaeumannomyces avenae]
MAQKTWFLPPDFTFRPSGELALGTIIKDPSRPTLALAALGSDEHPEIVLPGIETLLEPGHFHSHGSKRSGGANFLAKFVDLASASANANMSRYKEWSLGKVDLEVRTFNKAISEDSLKAITRLERVKRYMSSGRFGKKPVYIISGLRVAKDSFQVMDQAGSVAFMSMEASGPTPAWTLPLELGAGISGSREQSRTDAYRTAADIVYAYRVHVIRATRDGEEAELFSYRTAFGEGGNDEDEAQNMECVDVTANVLKEDLELEPAFDEYSLGEGESCIVFKGRT